MIANTFLGETVEDLACFSRNYSLIAMNKKILAC